MGPWLGQGHVNELLCALVSERSPGHYYIITTYYYIITTLLLLHYYTITTEDIFKF